MRVAAAFLIIAAMTLPARATHERILEPKPLLTTEQQTGATLGAAHTNRYCRFAQMRKSWAMMFPEYLIDDAGTGKTAEYRFVLYYGTILRISQLLPPDHESKCLLKSFVVDIESGKLDVGGYEHCGDDPDIRRTDAYYFDPEKKQRMGRRFKMHWDIELRRLMWKTGAIAAKCTHP